MPPPELTTGFAHWKGITN